MGDWFVLKSLISGLLVAGISETAKRSPIFGGLIASLPIVSVLSFIWIYAETKDTQAISDLSQSIFWLVLPSLALFLVLPELLKRLPFYAALLVSCMITAAAYQAMLWALPKLGIRL